MKLDTLGQLHAEQARNAVTDAALPPIEQIMEGQRSGRMVAALGWAAAAAMAVVVAVLVASPAPDLTPTTLAPAVDNSTTTTLVLPQGAWNPILATTRAKSAPPAATCPPGTDPNAPGPSGQDRPSAVWNGNLKAVFDQHTGRIVYVDGAGETWTFDVCTNTWQNMHPEFAPVPPEDLFEPAAKPSGDIIALVYDVDSDVTVAFGFERVLVYDANNNTWTKTSNDMIGFDEDGIVPMGATYDSVSGLIITTTMSVGYPDGWDVWAYNVDTNGWTPIGAVPLDRETPCCTQIDFLGYSQEIERLIFVTYVSSEETTVLIDPRTGETALLTTETPVVNLVWPSGVYGPAADTVYVKLGGDDICGFDTSTRTWSDCFDTPAALQDNRHTVFAAMVGDPINHRLILINSVGGDWWREATDDVWAIDLASGEWTELISPSGQ